MTPDEPKNEPRLPFIDPVTHQPTDKMPPIREVRSPMTLAEWQLCKPGDTIRLFDIRVEITEENYEPFMAEIGWYLNWWLGGKVGEWIMPNRNPSRSTLIGNAIDNAYIATGIYRTLCKYSVNPHVPSFWQRMRTAFSGGVPLHDE
jgi:hypothetical protein